MEEGCASATLPIALRRWPQTEEAAQPLLAGYTGSGRRSWAGRQQLVSQAQKTTGAFCDRLSGPRSGYLGFQRQPIKSQKSSAEKIRLIYSTEVMFMRDTLLSPPRRDTLLCASVNYSAACCSNGEERNPHGRRTERRTSRARAATPHTLSGLRFAL